MVITVCELPVDKELAALVEKVFQNCLALHLHHPALHSQNIFQVEKEQSPKFWPPTDYVDGAHHKMTSSQNQRYRAAQICRPIVVHMRLSHLIEFQFNSISIVCRSSWFLRGCVINWIRILGSIQLSFNFNFNWIEFQFRLFAVSWPWFMCA